MSLREKTKQRNQHNILKTAEDKFKQRGYQHTSMTEIARDAEVGTGTIYNYFPSKGALLIALFSEEMNVLRKKTQVELHDDTGGFMKQLMGILNKTLSFIEHYPKSFWRELIPALTEQSKEQSNILHQGYQLDLEAITWFEQLIEKNKDAFIVSIDQNQAGYTIYSVLAVQAIAYIFEPSMTYDQLSEGIRQQIHFIFDGKLK